MTITEILSEFRDLIRDTDSDNYLVSNAVAYSFINKEIEKIYNKLAFNGRGWKSSVQEYTLRTDAEADSNYQKYALPSDFLANKNMRYQYGNDWYPIYYKSNIRDIYSHTQARIPYWYELEGDYLIIYPPPEQTWTVELYYIPKYTKITSGTVVVPDNFRGRIINYCVYRNSIFMKDRPEIILSLRNEYEESVRDSRILFTRGVSFIREMFDMGNES